MFGVTNNHIIYYLCKNWGQLITAPHCREELLYVIVLILPSTAYTPSTKIMSGCWSVRAGLGVVLDDALYISLLDAATRVVVLKDNEEHNVGLYL